MKEATNILRKALNYFNYDHDKWRSDPEYREQYIKNPEHWGARPSAEGPYGPFPYHTYHLLNQPEHKAQGWKVQAQIHKIGDGHVLGMLRQDPRPPRDISNIKAIEVASRVGQDAQTSMSSKGWGERRIIVHKNPEYVHHSGVNRQYDTSNDRYSPPTPIHVVGPSGIHHTANIGFGELDDPHSSTVTRVIPRVDSPEFYRYARLHHRTAIRDADISNHPWKTTHIDSRKGGVVYESYHPNLRAALVRGGGHPHLITNVHYHDESE